MKRYGALIFIETNWYEDQILEIERHNIPVVVANLEISLDVSATWVDHTKSTRAAVKTLVDLGHRRIALITRPSHLFFYGKVTEAYLAGLEEAGIAAEPSLIAESKSTDPLSAYLATKVLLELDPPPTAIVAARDTLAHGAYEAITEAGLLVGRDISLIGFDDISWPQGQPFLTTFREPCYELGEVAAEMVIERIVSGWQPPEKRELKSPLILRRTVGPCFQAQSSATSPQSPSLPTAR